MAVIKIKDIIEFAITSKYDKVTWKVTLDEEGNDLVDQSVKDTNNLTEWNTPLPKGDGTFYKSPLPPLWTHIVLHYPNDVDSTPYKKKFCEGE